VFRNENLGTKLGSMVVILRSAEWYGGNDRNSYMHRAWMRRGLPSDALDSTRPQIAIANTASDLTPCNMHLNEVAEHVKAGIWNAGGVPYNLPVVSLGETQVRPTAMLWRNMAAMAMEEMFRANPIDGVVLLGGCDKTIPALLMAASSVDIPAVVIPGGPMLSGHFRGQALGCGTDVWRLSEEVRAGTMSSEEFLESEQATIRSKGHCNTMGTASTMAVVAEALGMTIPGLAGTPAADARLLSMSHQTGRLIVGMVAQGRRPSEVMIRESFLNAIIAVAAVGGSTNSVLHLLAIAGRLNVDLTLEDFDVAGAHVPVMANLQPSGSHLMDDLYRAGGLLAVLAQIRDLFYPEPITVTGKPLVDYLHDWPVYDREVIFTRESPLLEDAGIAVLRGNLAPAGAVIKPSAASPELLCHTGPVVVFDSAEEMREKIDDPDLEVSADSILVLRGCGPRGYPGMPEVGNMPIPKKLLDQGVRDMVRISDARMSGTAYGTVVLHVSPEAAAGGPLAYVQTGDSITLNVKNRTLTLHVSDDELLARNQSTVAESAYAKPTRGWEKLYVDHVLQADKGADLDFLIGGSGHEVARESH
jgi:dihydroxy-acid dehydratase